MAPEFQSVSYRITDRIRITGMSWERIFLNVTIESDYDQELSFNLSRVVFPRQEVSFEDEYNGYDPNVRIHLLRELPLQPVSSDRSVYTFRINMSILDGRSFPDNGRWYFVTRLPGDDSVIIPAIVKPEAYRLSELDRIFPYKKGRYAYTVHFTTQCMDTVNVIPVMHSRFMIENLHWKDANAVSDRRKLSGKLKAVQKKFKRFLLQLLYNIVYGLSRKDGTHILFMSETKPFLWGNLKFIDDRIRQRGLDSKFHLSYTFRIAAGKNNSFVSWFKTISLLARQDFVFVDDFAPLFDFLRLGSKTVLIQVWHAGEGFKAVGYGRFGSMSSPHPDYCAHRKYDYAITGSPRLVEVYSEVFGIPESCIFPLGMARLDNFLDEKVIADKTASFYEEHPECRNRKLILFAPTFRGPNQLRAYYAYDKLDFRKIYDFCGDDYIWAFKMHPFVRKKPPIPEEFRDRIIDLSESRDINDLYYVTDIMITDYSSAYYEFALLRRPVLFYTYDREIYELTRGVHKSIRGTAPGKVCDTFGELMTALGTGDFELEKTLAFADENFRDYDGHAADRIIDNILLNKTTSEE